MGVDAQDLKAYIGQDDPTDDAFIDKCWTEAGLLVDQALTSAFRPVPDAIRDRLYLEVGNELYNRKSAPSGQGQFAVFDGGSTPVRAPRDPLAQVRPIIRMYVVGF